MRLNADNKVITSLYFILYVTFYLHQGHQSCRLSYLLKYITTLDLCFTRNTMWRRYILITKVFVYCRRQEDIRLSGAFSSESQNLFLKFLSSSVTFRTLKRVLPLQVSAKAFHTSTQILWPAAPYYLQVMLAKFIN